MDETFTIEVPDGEEMEGCSYETDADGTPYIALEEGTDVMTQARCNAIQRKLSALSEGESDRKFTDTEGGIKGIVIYEDWYGEDDLEEILSDLRKSKYQKKALTAEEKIVEVKKKLTQIELARLLRSNQSRIAKMESGDASVSIDLLIKSLLALGTTKQDIAGIISSD